MAVAAFVVRSSTQSSETLSQSRLVGQDSQTSQSDKYYLGRSLVDFRPDNFSKPIFLFLI
jgi:hypothetical protein